MAEPEKNRAATFPGPPHFWKQFTPENKEKINGLRAAQEAASGSQSESTKSSQRKPPVLPARVLNLPSELLFLQPPLPPANGVYRVFGKVYTLNDELPSLAVQGIEQLYETPPATPTGTDNHQDLAFILKKLTKSVLLNFLELVGILSINPELAAPKIEDIRTHFVNIHHLLNKYRPHEERESLILLMEEQVERIKAETEGIYAMKSKVEGVLDGLKNIEIAEAVPLIKVKTSEVEDEMEDGYEVWEQLSQEFD